MYIELISGIASKVGISASLLLSICTTETGLRNVNNFKDGSSGSYGICQVKISTARSVVPHADLLALQQVSFNLYVAALLLKKLENKYHNTKHVISAYNAGHVFIENGSYRNQKYIDRVQKIYAELAANDK